MNTRRNFSALCTAAEDVGRRGMAPLRLDPVPEHASRANTPSGGGRRESRGVVGGCFRRAKMTNRPKLHLLKDTCQGFDLFLMHASARKWTRATFHGNIQEPKAKPATKVGCAGVVGRQVPRDRMILSWGWGGRPRYHSRPTLYMPVIPVGEAHPQGVFAAAHIAEANMALLLALFVALFAVSVSRILPWYIARKALHVGTGVLCIAAQAQGFDSLILSVGCIALAGILSRAVKIYPMKPSAIRSEEPSVDIGMLNFCVCTLACVALKVSLVHVSPVYFADPMGAIVGLNVRSPRIPGGGQKTIVGSLAVMIAAAASLVVFSHAPHSSSLMWGVLIASAEPFTGEWDNAAIAALLSLRYVILVADH